MGRIESGPEKGVLEALADASPEQLRVFIERLKEGKVPNGLVVLEELGGKEGFTAVAISPGERKELERRRKLAEGA